MRQTGVEINIARATSDDLVFLNKLNTLPHSAGTIFEVPIDGPEGISENHNTAVFVAQNKGEVVGFASVKIVDSRAQRLATIEHFGVNPTYWRKRIGNKLLGVVNAFLISKKVEKGFLISSNAGLLFYAKTNWKLADKKAQKFVWVPKPNPRIKLCRKR